MSKTTETLVKKTWTTWEELLLACAVKRYGLKNWDSVVMELQTRTSFPVLLTTQICKNKYSDLKRRFMGTTDDEAADDFQTGDDADTIPWLEELRKLRVAELKQEVHRSDLSIQSLQLKVKRLEEERGQSLKENENENEDEKPDLHTNLKEVISESGKNNGEQRPEKSSPGNFAGTLVPGEDSDRENRSFNESNSTENRETGVKTEPEPIETNDVKPDQDSKPVREDSCNDSSDTIAKNVTEKQGQDKRIDGDSAGLLDSLAESKEVSQETKESSDVQSSASLTNKRRQRGVVSGAGGGGGGGDEPVVSPATTIKRNSSVKSEPLVGFLDIIRSHKDGSVFERRLEWQKTDKYKNIIRQHVDLEHVQARIDDGLYSSCITKFYVDLLLLFNNAIVFFPKSSTEAMAAHDLRDLVMKELKQQQQQRAEQSDPSPESTPIPMEPEFKTEQERSDYLLAKHKSSAPIIVCRKRSSIVAKASSVIKTEKQNDEKPLVNPKQPIKSCSTSNDEESSMKQEAREKPVTGVRSMRRNRKNDATPNKNQHTKCILNVVGSTNKVDASKAMKKKNEIITTAKKSGAADFLKRIKKTSPGKGTTLDSLGDDGKTDQQKKKPDERKDGMVRRSGGGGKQVMKEESSPSKRSVGRPPKKGRDVMIPPAKRGREVTAAEVGDERHHKKRSRR